MSSWLKISYQYEKENDEIKVPKGITYGERASLFGKKTKEIRVVFRDDKVNNKGRGK